jgi:predicted CopG family antitoxin
MMLAVLVLLAMSDRTTIPLDAPTRDDLRAAKVGGESYDDVIRRLLAENGTEDGQ